MKTYICNLLILVALFLLPSCVLTEQEFSLKNKASIEKHCKMKMLHIPDSKEKRTKFKQCVYFRTQSLYDKYVSDQKNQAERFQKRRDEKEEKEKQRKHEIDLKTVPTNININSNGQKNNNSGNPAVELLKEIQTF